MLCVTALKDVSDTKGLRRFVIDSTGLAILERPELAEEIKIALANREPFTIRDNRVALI